MSELAPPLFPRREWVDDRARRIAEETELGGTAARYERRGTIFALEIWVRGGTFHRYSMTALDALMADLGVEEAVAAMRSGKSALRIEGEKIGYAPLGMRWTVFYRRAGGIEGEWGGSGGCSTAEDAAYSCLHLIEEHEREAYLEQLVVGTA